MLSCVHGFKRTSELFVFSWNEFCSVLHTSKSGLGKFGLLITLETPHYWSVVDHFQSLWEAFQLNTTNFLWLWIIWCPKKEICLPSATEERKKNVVVLIGNYNKAVFLGLASDNYWSDLSLIFIDWCSGKINDCKWAENEFKMFRSKGEKVS